MLVWRRFPNKAERQQVRARLAEDRKGDRRASADQIANSPANAIELHNKSGEKLLCFPAAEPSIDEEQRKTLTHYARLLPLELPTIELSGGSARCMMATITCCRQL